MDTDPIAELFDQEAQDEAADLEPGVSGVGSVLMEGIEAAGIEGRTVLDLGCGTGALTVDAVIRGASRATGIDLSPESIALARRRATEAGVADRVDFHVGNAAEADAGQHDVVLLNKVFCCYPDPNALAERSLPEAGSVYAFSLPISRGIRGVLGRTALWLENLWHRIRGRRFRAYVHDVDRLDARVRAGGFVLRSTGRQGFWHAAVYVRQRGG